MSFKFHYFSIGKQYKTPFSARNLISTMKLLSNRNTNDYNNNEELNINTIRSFQLTHNIDSNKKIKNTILSKNLEKEINSKNLKEILPLMLTYNNYLPDDTKIENEKKNNNDIECSNLISCFQLLIKYLYEKKEEEEKMNNIFEQKISALKNETDLKKCDELIQKNNQTINKLREKKIKLRAFLLNNGKELPSENSKQLYICNLCPRDINKSNSYRAFHQHYVKYHINPYSFYNTNYNMNINMYSNIPLDQNYFDTKVNEVLEQVKTTLIKSKSQKKNELGKKFKTLDYGSDTGMLKSARQVKINGFDKKKFELIKERIENIEKNQKEFENEFKLKVDNFLNELKQEIEKINLNK